MMVCYADGKSEIRVVRGIGEQAVGERGRKSSTNIFNILNPSGQAGH